jgi:hypothetical protein
MWIRQFVFIIWLSDTWWTPDLTFTGLFSQHKFSVTSPFIRQGYHTTRAVGRWIHRTTTRAVHVRSSLLPLTIPGTKFSTRPYVWSFGEVTTRPHVWLTCGPVWYPCYSDLTFFNSDGNKHTKTKCKICFLFLSLHKMKMYGSHFWDAQSSWFIIVLVWLTQWHHPD